MSDTLFPLIVEAQREPKQGIGALCTGGNGFDYICRDCCEMYGKDLALFDVNAVGRKGCAFCGDNSDMRLDSVRNEARTEGGHIVYYEVTG